MTLPAIFVWLVLLVTTAKMPLEDQVLVADTWQNLSNLYLFGYLWALPIKHLWTLLWKHLLLRKAIEQHVLDTNAGKQLP
jgi:hypothetical protein